jgi:hypothetical protein
MAFHAEPNEPDYTVMKDGDLLEALGDDASKWAEAFCQIKASARWSADDIDRDLMIAWFANAIEHSHDVRRNRAEKAAKGDVTIPRPSLQ